MHYLMTRKKQLFLCLLSGLLFVPAWYTWGSGLFLFVAFIPLLFVEADMVERKVKGSSWFWLPFLTFVIWNFLTTWWLKNASFPGMLFAVAINSFFMSIPFWLFTQTHRRLGDGFGYFSLLFYWLAFEFLYLHGEISWTWLNLGNGFANNVKLIQWYEFTGTLGGSAWVLMVNMLLFKTIRSYLTKKTVRPVLTETILAALLIIVPITWSVIRYHTYTEKSHPYNIAIIQPNIDPYEKFNDIPPDQQMDILLHIADSLGSPSTDYFVAPETFINNNVWESEIHLNESVLRIKRFVERYPRSKFVIGATTYRLYSDMATKTARPFQDKYYYDSFNSALQIDTSNNIPIYHKSQLVVGVEKMPYPQYFRFLEKLTLRLGGTFRSNGTQDYREAFPSPQDSTRVGPVICYESIFGEFVTDYVSQAGANLIFVITNDGWWGNTPGYIQHNSFSSLRAIETRRSIARSANTGISSFIDQRGKILQSLGWWKRGGLKGSLNANDAITFYVQYGDYIGRISVFTGILILLYTLVRFLIKKS